MGKGFQRKKDFDFGGWMKFAVNRVVVRKEAESQYKSLKSEDTCMRLRVLYWPFRTSLPEANKRWVKILSVFTRRSVEVGRMIANQM